MGLKNFLSNDKITIFSKHNCVECVKIKEFLNQNKFKYKLVNIETICDEEVFTLIDELKNTTESKTFPFCFYYGTFVSTDTLKKKLMIFEVSDDF